MRRIAWLIFMGGGGDLLGVRWPPVPCCAVGLNLGSLVGMRR